MARIWVVLAVVSVVLVGSALPALAEEGGTSGTTETSGPTGALGGSRELVFTFDGWHLGSYEGGVGLRCFLKDDVAIRAGLDLSITDSSGDRDSHYDGGRDGSTSDYEKGTIEVSVLAERYLGRLGAITPFLAAGLAYAYSSSDRDEYSFWYGEFGEEPGSTESYSATDHAVSLVGAFGVRWHFTDRLSLGGQCNLGVTQSWTDSRTRRVSYDMGRSYVRTREDSSNDTDISVDAGSLLLSAEF
jgi:hypothetical protein